MVVKNMIDEDAVAFLVKENIPGCVAISFVFYVIMSVVVKPNGAFSGVRNCNVDAYEIINLLGVGM